MARPRKPRFAPLLAPFGEELLRVVRAEISRQLVSTVENAVHKATQPLRTEIVRLRRQLAQKPADKPRHRGRPRSSRLCSARGCEQPHVARGLCKNHYQRLRYAERRLPNRTEAPITSGNR